MASFGESRRGMATLASGKGQSSCRHQSALSWEGREEGPATKWLWKSECFKGVTSCFCLVLVGGGQFGG